MGIKGILWYVEEMFLQLRCRDECPMDVYHAGCFTSYQTAQNLLVDHASAGSTTSKRLCGVEASHWLKLSVPACSTTEDSGEGLQTGLRLTCEAPKRYTARRPTRLALRYVESERPQLEARKLRLEAKEVQYRKLESRTIAINDRLMLLWFSCIVFSVSLCFYELLCVQGMDLELPKFIIWCVFMFILILSMHRHAPKYECFVPTLCLMSVPVGSAHASFLSFICKS